MAKIIQFTWPENIFFYLFSFLYIIFEYCYDSILQASPNIVIALSGNKADLTTNRIGRTAGHHWREGGAGNFRFQYPAILGQERDCMVYLEAAAT